MRYGIIDKQCGRFMILSDSLTSLRKTITLHMPQFCVDDIEEYADNGVECGFDGFYYLKGALPEQPAPLAEEVKERRRQYRIENCDSLTLEKVRKTSLGCWTAEDEAAYVKKMREINDYIIRNMPYPAEQEQYLDNGMSVVPHVGIDV